MDCFCCVLFSLFRCCSCIYFFSEELFVSLRFVVRPIIHDGISMGSSSQSNTVAALKAIYTDI